MLRIDRSKIKLVNWAKPLLTLLLVIGLPSSGLMQDQSQIPNRDESRIGNGLRYQLQVDAAAENGSNPFEVIDPPGYPFSASTAPGNPFANGAPSHGILAGGSVADPLIYAVDIYNEKLLKFRSRSPSSVTSLSITGVNWGAFETITGIDFVGGQLYAVVTDLFFYDRLVKINVNTGVASAVGPKFSHDGSFFGVDGEPNGYYIHQVSDTGLNRAFEKSTLVMSNFPRLSSPLGQPRVVHLAFQAKSAYDVDSVLGIDSDSNALVRVGEYPNHNGQIQVVGPLGVNCSSFGGFDIQYNRGRYYSFAALYVNGLSKLYSVNLSTGRVALVGAIGSSSTFPIIDGIAIDPASF